MMLKWGFVLAALAGLVGPGLAEELIWMGFDDRGGAELAYALPESDFVIVHMACTGPGKASFVHFPAPSAIIDGETIRVSLSSTGGTTVVEALASISEMDDMPVLDGEVAVDDQLRQILSGEDLFIEARGGEVIIDLDGALEAAEMLFAQCGTSGRAVVPVASSAPLSLPLKDGIYVRESASCAGAAHADTLSYGEGFLNSQRVEGAIQSVTQKGDVYSVSIAAFDIAEGVSAGQFDWAISIKSEEGFSFSPGNPNESYRWCSAIPG
jgi:hypothetical protein